MNSIRVSTFNKSAELIRKRLETIQKKINDIEKLPILEDKQINILKSYESESREKCKEFEQILCRLLSSETESETHDENAISTIQDSIYELNVEITSQIVSLIPVNKSPNESSDNSNSSNELFHEKPNSSSVRLPKINLPEFNGNIKTWISFYNLFETTIHSNTSLTPVEKFQYLICSLKGEALGIIKSLPISAANYQIAYELLQNRYHNSRRLVNYHINNIIDLENVKDDSKSLRNFISLYKENQQALVALNQTLHEDNALLLTILLRKLEPKLRKKFEDSRNDCQDIPSVYELISFLETECRHYEDANLNQSEYKRCPSSDQRNVKGNLNDYTNKLSWRPDTYKSTLMVSGNSLKENKISTSKCAFCSLTSHHIYQCKDFQHLNSQERHSFIKNKGYCFNCLSEMHTSPNCNSTKSCMKCGKRHHTYLHLEPKKNYYSINDSQNNIPNHQNNNRSNNGFMSKYVQETQNGKLDSTTFVALSAKPQTSILLATTIAKLSTPNGRQFQARGILDSAAQSSYISQRLANLMSVKRNHSPDVIINGISMTQVKTKGVTHLTISSNQGKVLVNSHPFTILQDITSFMPRCSISEEVKTKCHNLILADPHFDAPGAIDFLIGADLYGYLFTGEKISLGSNMPTAFGTLLGFVLLGKAPVETHKTLNCLRENSNSLSTLLTVSSENLHDLIQRFWEVENLPQPSKMSDDEMACENHFVSTHARNETGRYIVKQPFKQDPQCLGDSKSLAEQQFLSIEKRMNKNPSYKSSYSNAFKDYVSSNHIVKVDAKEEIPSRNCYLPHHGVLRESSSTPLRIVFNGSAKTSNNLSLNNCMYAGPKLQSNVIDVITRFRFNNIVFSCDIKQMYRQIIVDTEDQYLQLLIWRDSPEQPLQTYKLTRVVFGLTSSPYLALRCLKQLSLDEGHNYPQAANLLNTNTFVDDITGGSSTVEECLIIQRELVQLLHKGGFELAKWASNSPEFLKSLNESNHGVLIPFSQSNQPSHSILGLQWDPKSDTFHYKVNPLASTTLTKRYILSVSSSLWDPSGWLTPVTFYAKCFIQLLWTLGLSWDEKVPPEVADKWIKFVEDLPKLKDISIDRCYILNKSSTVELHGFGDASESGYAGVVYIRTVSIDDKVKISLMIAKSKVAPLKRLSLPRLELCAAHMVAKLLKHCQELVHYHCKELKVFAWSDSTIALSWIKTPSYRLKVFVANRVADIQQLVPSSCWFHVSSEQNPADFGSRGLFPSELVKCKLWFNGPQWLLQDQELRPVSKFDCMPQTELPEIKPPILDTLVVIKDPTSLIDDLTNKCSSWTKLIKVMAYVKRFIDGCKKISTYASRQLSLEELEIATLTVCKLVQEQSFSSDIKAIEKGKDCSIKLIRLAPFIDSNGILRVGGRLKFANISSDQKHPIILPKGHAAVKYLIDYYHVKNLHAGPQLCQAVLQEKYWILSSRSIIRSRIFKCLRCFRAKPKQTTPLMGDLPSARLTPERPFTNTGVDYAGPFKVKLHTMRRLQNVKVYLCIFICFVTKAVHIEVVTDMTSDAYIAALTRFISRRGIVKNLYSDCGTNFVGAAAKVKKIFKSFLLQSDTKKTLLNFTNNIPINFHFLPPAAPHMGGLWESAVKSAKYHLTRVLGTYVPTLEEFMTLSTNIESMLNSRPLTSMSNDPSDLTPLTPAHFLIGSSLIALPEENVVDTKTNRLTRWQTIQSFNQRIWKRWHKEYLNTLQQRFKWNRATKNHNVGDLVLVHEHDSPPLCWPLGRIIQVFPGSDNAVRVVKVKTAKGVMLRPAVKVFTLPAEE